MLEKLKNNLSKNGYTLKNKVYSISNSSEEYSSNFGKQWRDFSKTQIDEFNKTEISKNLLDNLIFNEYENLKDKNILEVGCGSGRFSQYLSKYANLLVVNDMSDAIYHNHYLDKNNVIAIKSDFSNLMQLEIKFDLVICRGVLQHTPDPYKSILNLHDLCKENGCVYFDIYKKPKFKIINPKYIWRKIIKYFFTYEKLYSFLQKNIDNILKVRRKLNKFFRINLNYFWDYFFPIYDYKEKLPLSNLQLKEWAILDTLDGLITTYDIPLSKNEIKFFLNKFDIKISKYNDKFSSFKIIKNEK